VDAEARTVLSQVGMRTYLLVACQVAAVGCGDPPGGSADAALLDHDAPTADAATTPDAAPPDAGPAWTCAPGGVVHLAVNPVPATATIPDGRLVVVFYQLLEPIAKAVPLFVGYDAPFAGTATTVDIPLASIVLPTPTDDYRLCPRTCFDLANPACDCPAAQPAVSLAMVFVMNDLDDSGAIEPAELVEENFYGVGFMHLGHADEAFPPPNVLDPLFPEGISGCLSPYRIVPPSGDDFDQLGLPPEDTTFPMDVCVPGAAACDDVRFPNLT
jgi:hypothetical protein